MGFIGTLTNAIFYVCSATADFVLVAYNFVGTLLAVNYRLVSAACATVVSIYDGAFRLISIIYSAVYYIGISVWEFLYEVAMFVSSFAYFAWLIVLLVYRVCCVLCSSLESLIAILWTGSVLVWTTVKHSIVDISEICELTLNTGIEAVTGFCMFILYAFSSVGRLSASAVTGAWQGVGYIFSSLLNSVAFFGNKVQRIWTKLVESIIFTFTGLSNETYLGVIIVCMVYLLLSNIFRYFQSSELSFRRHTPNTMHNIFDFDEFESDVDFSEHEAREQDSEDGESEEVSDGTSSDAESDEDGLDVSDDDDDDESILSLNSQAFSASEGSDDEVDTRFLPRVSAHSIIRGRSFTPSHAANILSNEDFERAIECERDKRKCVVCQDQMKSVLLLPCRHMCLCVDCANRIVRSGLERRVCPLCRQKIQRVIDAYV